MRDMVRHGGEVSLLVLVALSDASRGERLAASLAGLGGIMALVSEDMESGHAEVAVVDDVATAKSLPPGTLVILLSDRGSPATTHGVVAATLGADADPVLIAAAARLTAAGYRIIGGAVGASSPLPNEVANDPGETAASLPIHLPVHLSPRETEVLALLAEGAPNKVIARRLGISVHTVKFHVTALLVKLGVANRTDAIATAMRQGLVLV